MSRITKLKLEKTKVKVVFRLQFHATHVPLTGWDKLFISFIPVDSGKTTAKTTKVNVRNGTCKWADPIYESTRLLQDSKSKQCDEKLYKLLVAMGSSRASILGEATINLSDYVDALKPSAMALPLHGCNFGTILHITVQLLTSKTGFREFEQQRDQRERGLQSGVDSHGHSGAGKIPYSEEVASDQTYKVSARVRFKTDSNKLSLLEEDMNLNEEYADSAAGFDGSSNTSESLCAEKHETSSTRDVDSIKSTISGDLHELSHCQSPHLEKGDPSDHQNMSSDSAVRWGPDYSIDNELAIACEEINRLRESLELAESSILNLKLEVSSLQSLAGELGTETQKYSYLLASEICSGEELAKEVSVVKSECLKFKDDLIRLKDLKSIPHINITKTSFSQIDPLLQDVPLQFLWGISAVEGKIRELQSKAYVVGHDCDGRFIYSGLEALLNILQGVKCGNVEATSLLNVVPSERTDVKKIQEIGTEKNEQFISGNGFGLDLCQSESILHHLSMVPPVSDPVGAIDALNGQKFDLVRELDEAKVEKEGLTRKMDKMECYYEALIQELEENQKQMVGELHHLGNEHSICLHSLSASRAEMESMCLDMNQQMLQLDDEKHDLDVLNKELERRVASSEAALRRARLNYSIAVDKLQKDLELLSSQVVSMFETNENIIKQTFVEPSQPCLQGDQKLLQNPDDYDVTKLPQYQNQCLGVGRKSVPGDILLEDLKRTFSLQEELYQKVEEELSEMYYVNLNLDIYSKTLKESLLEANADIIIMKGKMDEFVEEVKLSTASQNQLVARLHKATDDIHTLNEYKSSCISQCSDMALQNQLLEDKLESMSKENHLLSEKLKDWEIIIMEHRICKSKFETCLTENAELSLSLKQEAFEKDKFQNELSLLKDKLSILKAESVELASLKENLEENIIFVEDKMANLLESYNKQFCVLANFHYLNLEHTDIKDAILKLEEIQHNAYRKIFQLIEQNKNLEGERVIAQVSLSTARSEILAMKRKFKSDIQDVVTKLDESNSLVDKFQVELESVANKFQFSSEIEEKYAEQSKALLADFGFLEDQMQELTCTNGHFAQEISCLDALAEELGSSKSAITALMQQKQELVISLQDEAGESSKLSSEITCLKENLRNLRDDLQIEKGYKDELEREIRDLTSQWNKDHDKLLDFEQQNAELMHVRDLALDLELEKSRLSHLLGQQKVFIEELHQQIANQASVECQLFEMYDYSLATDLKLIYVSNQYEILCEKHLQQLLYSERSLRELEERYHELEAMLNQCLASEARLSEEIANLLTILKSLKSELEISGAQNMLLSDSNNHIKNQFGECMSKLTIMETSSSWDKNLQTSEIEKLKNMMIDAEKEISYLTVSKEELEIFIIVLKGKLDERCTDIALLTDYKDVVMVLRSQCDEISHKLSEQVLKTEEFKNLSIHLKELKDNAEAECFMVREKREAEGPPVAMQDSLRIAFFKEQYATQIQELKQQLSISKNHGEEMLLKLQDAIDDIENRKKSEAVNLKRNEELSHKILAMETESQLVHTEKREISKTYDRIKAEYECALLSLECCKEEKGKLEASLQECKAEKSQLAIELNLVKGKLEKSTTIKRHENGSSTEVECLAIESTKNSSPISLERDESMCGSKREHATSILAVEDSDLTESIELQTIQDGGMHRIPEAVLEESPQSNGKNLDVNSECLGSHLLKSSMEHLHEELEKMKNENIDLHIDHDMDPDFQVPQKEIVQLQKANAELRSMFPLFNEISSCGNAFERVFALEIELAEALKAKNKLNTQFQSSFLKQHTDDEAVFKSFRDINELIKETLELKGRHATVEAELREMHNRYSQLSLQFAEVEGERQKLKMTLKNVRASRKLVTLNPSTPAS